jgi:hypothetical protein
VAGLLATVAHTLRRCLLGAVARQMADLAAYKRLVMLVQVRRRLLTVVALLALGAVTAHVTETTARVAGGLASTSIATGTSGATVASTTAAVAAASSTAVATALGAVAGNVTDLAALVALLAAAAATATHLGTTVLGALARDVAGTTAAVAGLLSLGRGAFTANVTLLAAVVAGRGALGGALGSAVRGVSAWTWSARVQSDA